MTDIERRGKMNKRLSWRSESHITAANADEEHGVENAGSRSPIVYYRRIKGPLRWTQVPRAQNV